MTDDAEFRIQELERQRDQDAIRIHELSSALEAEVIARHDLEAKLEQATSDLFEARCKELVAS